MNAPHTSSALDNGADDNGLALSIGALAVAAASTVTLAFVDLGPLSAHMATHIASMNVVAPLAAMALRRVHPRHMRASPVAGLWLATVGQLALLWASHSPTLHHAAQSNTLVLAGLHAALFGVATVFWICILDAGSSRWQAMLALLVSGKLACLLGALLIFAPRFLFESAAATHASHGGHAATLAATLADQHLAGLLMIAACPLSYVLTAIVLAAQTITGLESARSPAFSSRPAAGR